MSAPGSPLSSVISPKVGGAAIASAGADCPEVAPEGAGAALAEGDFELESACPCVPGAVITGGGGGLHPLTLLPGGPWPQVLL